MSTITSVIAKSDDGTISITFSIPYDLVSLTKNEVLGDISKNSDIPGFRKGMAPLTKVEEVTPKDKITEKILGKLLPKAFADEITKNKIVPAIYPKFEAVKLEDGKNWEIRAITCEIPEIKLGDYKTLISGELRAMQIVIPGKKEEVKTETDKQNSVISAINKHIKLNLPKLIIDEEVNLRLSSLLQKIEKLGLQLEGYLKSINETAESLRKKYEDQAVQAISLELILNKIAEEEKIEVEGHEIEDFIKTTGSDTAKVTDDQKEMLKRVILRRKALEKLAAL